MSNEPGIFDKVRGHIIRGHELGMGLAIVALTFYSAVITLGLAMSIPNSTNAKQQAAYNLGHDVGLFCGTDMYACTIVCRNNYDNETMKSDCLRGIVNGYNSKDVKTLGKEVTRSNGEPIPSD